MAGKNFGVFRRRPDFLRHTRRIKPITITAPPVVPILRQTGIRFNRVEDRRRFDYYLRFTKRVKPITITAPPAPVASVLRRTGTFVDYKAFERKFDYYLRFTKRSKPITITAPPVVPILRQTGIRFNRVEDRRRFDYYLRYTRRIKPITITAVVRTVLLRSTAEIYRNRAVFRREFDYYLRFTKRIKPITITAPPAVSAKHRSLYMAIEYETILENVSPDDSNNLTNIGMLYIGTGGDVKVTSVKGDTVTLKNVPDGTWLNFCRVIKVFSTGTTASDIVLAR